MAPIKFSYFDVAFLGESVRLALALSGVEWEDNRVDGKDWPALKPTLPYGQLPVLEVDGAVIPQSLAQLRYAGKIGGLYPTDPIEAAFADAAADAFMDIYTPIRNAFVEKDEEKKVQLQKDLAENVVPSWLSNMEKILDNAGGQYFAGGKAGSLAGTPKTVVDGYPLLSSLVERVMAEPRIVEYMEGRPRK